MIKFLFKTLIAVIILLLLIPLSRLLIWLVTLVFADLGAVICGNVDPLGIAALLLIGIAIFLIVLACKS